MSVSSNSLKMMSFFHLEGMSSLRSAVIALPSASSRFSIFETRLSKKFARASKELSLTLPPFLLADTSYLFERKSFISSLDGFRRYMLTSSPPSFTVASNSFVSFAMMFSYVCFLCCQICRYCVISFDEDNGICSIVLHIALKIACEYVVDSAFWERRLLKLKSRDDYLRAIIHCPACGNERPLSIKFYCKRGLVQKVIEFCAA